jgi:hypothetical protein
MMPLVLLIITIPVVVALGILYVREVNRSGREQS